MHIYFRCGLQIVTVTACVFFFYLKRYLLDGLFNFFLSLRSCESIDVYHRNRYLGSDYWHLQIASPSYSGLGRAKGSQDPKARYYLTGNFDPASEYLAMVYSSSWSKIYAREVPKDILPLWLIALDSVYVGTTNTATGSQCGLTRPLSWIPENLHWNYWCLDQHTQISYLPWRGSW